LDIASSRGVSHFTGVTPPPYGFTSIPFPFGNLSFGVGRFSGKNTLSKSEPFQKQTSVPCSTSLTPGGLARKPYATDFESADHTRTHSDASNRSVSAPVCRVTMTLPVSFSINSTVG